MSCIRCGRLAAASLTVIVFCWPMSLVSAPYSSSSTDAGAVDSIPRWKPTYKPAPTRPLTQRERRTGATQDYTKDDEGFAPRVKEVRVQPVAPKKRGIWPFKKEREKEKKAKEEASKGKKGFLGKVTKVFAGNLLGVKKGATAVTVGVGQEEKAEEMAAKEEDADAAKSEKKPARRARKVALKEIDLPRDTPDDYLHGKGNFDKENWDEAIRHFSKFIAANDEDNPLLAPARYFVAKSFAELKQRDVALRLYAQIQEEHPDSRFWSGLARFELAAISTEDDGWVTPDAGETDPQPAEATDTEPAAGDGDTVAEKPPATGDTGKVPTEVAPAGAPSEAPGDAPDMAPGN